MPEEENRKPITSQAAFGPTTEAELKAAEASKKADDAAIAAAREAARACFDSEAFKRYEEKFSASKAAFLRRFREVDFTQGIPACIKASGIQAEIDVLESLLTVVKIDAGLN